MDVLELDLLEALGLSMAGIDVADGAGDLLEALGHATGSLALLTVLGPVDGLANEGRGPLRGTSGVEVLRRRRRGGSWGGKGRRQLENKCTHVLSSRPLNPERNPSILYM